MDKFSGPLLIALLMATPKTWGFQLLSNGISTSAQHKFSRLLAATPPASAEEESIKLDEHLLDIAHRLKLEIFDLDEGIFGFETKDVEHGLEVIQTEIPLSSLDQGLGLVLTEVAGHVDGRGLVMIREVSGNAAKASNPIQVGDVITGIRTPTGSFRARTTGLNYDRTVEKIGEAKQMLAQEDDFVLHLELNRVVKRAKIVVEVESPEKDGTVVQSINGLAGENLRRLLLRKSVSLYDSHTKRFDMPFSTGDCAGEGLCGTCLVAIRQITTLDNEGTNGFLNPPNEMEKVITRGRPCSWRASCRTVVGANNQEGTVRIVVKPQSQYKDELDSGVKKIAP